MTKETRICNGVKTVYSINGVGRTGQIMQKYETRLSYCTIYIINSKNTKRLNVRPKTIKLEEIISSKLSDVALSNIFSDTSPWAKETKEMINKWYYIELKSFCQ